MRAALTPPLDTVSVGTVMVATVDMALTADELMFKSVSDKLASWNSARRVLRALADKVDRNNKRW